MNVKVGLGEVKEQLGGGHTRQDNLRTLRGPRARGSKARDGAACPLPKPCVPTDEGSVKLPPGLRHSLGSASDDYFETENADPDVEQLAQFIADQIESSAEESGLEEVDELLARIEEDARLEESVAGTLEYELGQHEDLELTGEEVMSFVEKVLRLRWHKKADLVEELEDDFEADEEDDDEPSED